MKPGQKILVLRYGNNIVPDCIGEHQKTIEQYGYCWFGKIGTSPSAKILNAVLAEEEPQVVLYVKAKAHICNLEAVTDKQPMEGCPEYYREYLFDQFIFPKIYFKLTGIEELPLSELGRCVVCSSKAPLLDTLNRSMSSFIFAELPDPDAKAPVPNEKANKTGSPVRKEKRPLLDKNDCVYRKDGKCTCRSCISYQYECERPSMCLKQKR